MQDFSKYDEAFAKALATASVIAGDAAWDKAYCEHLKSFFDQWPAEPSMEAAHNHAAARSGLADYSTLAPQAIAAIETLAKVYGQLKKVVDDTPAPMPYRAPIDIEDTSLAPNVGPLDVVSYARQEAGNADQSTGDDSRQPVQLDQKQQATTDPGEAAMAEGAQPAGDAVSLATPDTDTAPEAAPAAAEPVGQAPVKAAKVRS